jgi:predicted dehydrogenase
MGEVFAFDGDYLYGRLSKITDGWRAEVEDYSVMAGGGIHLVDLLLWITGQRPTVVSALGNRLCAKETRFRYADYVAATMNLPDGMIARITANFGCVHGHQHVVRAFGTKATFIYDDQGPRWQTHRDPAPPAMPLNLAPLPASKYQLIAGYVDAILHDEELSLETQMDFDSLSVCFACDAALRTQSPHRVDYV